MKIGGNVFITNRQIASEAILQLVRDYLPNGDSLINRTVLLEIEPIEEQINGRLLQPENMSIRSMELLVIVPIEAQLNVRPLLLEHKYVRPTELLVIEPIEEQINGRLVQQKNK